MALQEHGEVREGRLPRRREDLEPMCTGRMGSACYRWRFAPADLPVVLAHDWSQMGRRISVDPECGEVTLTAPSGPHEGTSRLPVHLVSDAAQALSIPCFAAGATTWSLAASRRVEADESFYLGKTASGCMEVLDTDRADAFFADIPPKLVIEVERSHSDDDKPAVYRALGVPEMWRIDVSRPRSFAVEILELQCPGGWRPRDHSTVLPGLTPVVIARTLRTARRHGYWSIPDALAAAGIGCGTQAVEPESEGPGY